ncbi:MAG: aminomethyl-transferring glycine dehydrogenase subunit GcvPA [Hyphomicrobiaceae bacterium]
MRYLPLESADRAHMLASIGVGSVDDLFAAVPADKLMPRLPRLPLALSEIDVERELTTLAGENRPAGSGPFFCGAGAYRHHVPATVDHLIQRSEFLTSYTPYQPEISQGTLQVLFEFQTQVALLTGMEVANASMYDGSTATAEAVLMAHRITRRRKAIVSGALHPQYRDVIRTLSQHGGTQMVALPPLAGRLEDFTLHLDDTVSCVVVQYPDFFGSVRDLSELANAVHACGALLIVAVTEVVSLGAIRSPGEMGADIVTAEGQSIGNGLNFGGPYVGLFACRTRHVRQMPGRLCGETVDSEGRRGFVLTLSTREQHIRRDKATSNICTNSGLCALAFSIHLTLLGERGLRQVARLNHANAAVLADMLSKVPGVEVLNDAFFNEFTVRLPRDAAEVVDALADKGVLAGVPVSRLEPEQNELSQLLVIACTEINTDADRAAFAAALAEVLA